MSERSSRTRLSRDRVIAGAVDLADRIGVDALTIRRLADHLGVKPMSIYHHVASKEEIIDGMVDVVFAEIDLPSADADWRTAIRSRCVSARAALVRHPWAPPLMDSRTNPGPASLRQHDAVIGCLLGGGLSFALAAHAYAILDSFVYGFTLQQASMPATGGEDLASLATDIVEALPRDEYPNFAAFVANVALQPGYEFAASFEFGLELILDGLEAARVNAG
ncbi:MAG: TetR/AcrR family transcriptional regulator [Thermoleophilia bacterium]